MLFETQNFVCVGLIILVKVSLVKLVTWKSLSSKFYHFKHLNSSPHKRSQVIRTDLLFYYFFLCSQGTRTAGQANKKRSLQMRSVFLILTALRSFVEFAVNGGLPVIPLTLWTDIFLFLFWRSTKRVSYILHLLMLKLDNLSSFS